MKKTLRYILFTLGLVTVSLFCVSATATATDAQPILKGLFSEPVNMLVLGVGLIGFGSFIKSRLLR